MIHFFRRSHFRTRSIFYLSFLLITISVFTGCTKVVDQTIAVKDTRDGISPFPFDWDNPNTNYMPTPSGTTILLPWANGASKGFSNDILYDYSKNDGWELVYNVFNTTSLQANPYFVLYNKYRGLLRIYVYVTTNAFTTSTYLTSGLTLGPNAFSSHMLNYINQDIVDFNVKKNAICQIEPTQLSANTWYASQYEIAYDPLISTHTYQEVGLNWTEKWTNITQVSMGGSLVGSLNGTVGTPPSQFNLAGTLINGVFNATGLAVLNNNKGTTDPNNEGVGNHLGLPAVVFNAIKEGVTSGYSGAVKNIFNAIFGGNSGNYQEINLTLKADLTLNGSETSGGAFIPDPGLLLGVPGTSNSQTASGYIPGYDQPMGIFYINAKPQIQVVYTQQSPPSNWDGPSNRYYLNDFYLQTSSFGYLINPSVTNIATVSIVSQEVLLPETVADPTNHFYTNSPYIELVGANGNYYKGVTMDGSKILPGQSAAVLRVTVRVTPNNGAPASTIVKTFLADLIN